jgi:hypothetical protein
MVARQKKSDFQILGHFAKRSAAGVAAHIGGRAAEFTSEGVSEVAVAGKPQFEGKCREILSAFVTGKVKTVAPMSAPTFAGLSFSPDGPSLLFSQLDEVVSDLMLVENFR